MHIMRGHYFHEKIKIKRKTKFYSVTYLVGHLFHSLKVACVYNKIHTHFCLVRQNSDLAGTMSFQKKKIFTALKPLLTAVLIKRGTMTALSNLYQPL